MRHTMTETSPKAFINSLPMVTVHALQNVLYCDASRAVFQAMEIARVRGVALPYTQPTFNKALIRAIEKRTV